MADKPTARFPVSDESDAVAELLADFLDRSGVDTTPEIMRDVIRRHGLAPPALSRIRGAAFSGSMRSSQRDPHGIAMERSYEICLAAHKVFQIERPASDTTLARFLRAVVDHSVDPELGRQAGNHITRACEREIGSLRSSTSSDVNRAADLLVGFRDTIQQLIGNLLTKGRGHPLETGLAPPSSAPENTDATDASIHGIDQGSSTGYDGAPDSVPEKRSTIERDPVLEQLTETYVKAACDTTHPTGAFAALLMTAVRAWRLGRPIRLVTDIGGTVEIRDVPAPGTGTTGFDEAVQTLVARPTPGTIVADHDFGPPVPSLSDDQIEAIKQRALERPWNNRGPNPPTPFEWVRDNYGEWIPGLLQGHLKSDLQLYNAFTQRVRREGLPDWLDVPTEPDARLRNTTDLRERQRLLTARQAEAERARRRRAEGLMR